MSSKQNITKPPKTMTHGKCVYLKVFSKGQVVSKRSVSCGTTYPHLHQPKWQTSACMFSPSTPVPLYPICPVHTYCINFLFTFLTSLHRGFTFLKLLTSNSKASFSSVSPHLLRFFLMNIYIIMQIMKTYPNNFLTYLETLLNIIYRAL